MPRLRLSFPLDASQPSLHLIYFSSGQDFTRPSTTNTAVFVDVISKVLATVKFIGHQHTSSEQETRQNMLRRPPTAITLTTEDVVLYEDNRTREALLEEQAALEAAQAKALAQARQSTPQKNQNVRNPNDELRPLPPDRTRAPQKTREERLGLGGGSSSRG